MCKLNPKVDFAFKKLFGSEENKCILISFINSIISEENQIKNIELKNPYNISNYRKGKMTILDIKAVDEKGIWYDIEMQIAEQGYYDKRALYYWSKVYSDQIESGDDFELLRKTIGINILDFNYLKEEDFHNIYRMYNEKTKEEFSDLFEMHFIELNKFKKDYKDIKTALDRWVSFLNRAYEIDKDEIPKELGEDENIKIAIEKLDIMYLDKEEREIYENDLKALRIHKAEIKTAEENGIKKGREEGEKKKAFEIAKNLLDVLDNETIAIKTGLTIDEIEKLRYN
ncbi:MULTISPECIES: Rpn family recombination-promoting nuclease/putative transposase [Clostridium]|uniref:Transposase n=2 Tax=Clostridium TaxID=1485 RepID=A0A1S9N8V1_CLOBE|nr:MULTISPECIES: Rpn family recombination-promoting nuclease/putative transposase [Clostridium]MBN7573916.1 PD-(D/E)XK nuclease family transposase [Clostridium beijerinckii]MBN7577596.1 PD-(D/E)XK nuclease family transposase [Clostridium beijerinckii]MBN7583666.1 PD-(D/E)XK nuclease family transposase [Clostridium beijerinckii]MBO0519912.1 PD-(D/E)XK nuclease family transposase [Clostridium beijerinckii]OOP73840.1 transposase [Clostridium beijerinckii]